MKKSDWERKFWVESKINTFNTLLAVFFSIFFVYLALREQAHRVGHFSTAAW
jgi:hypothetical protein